MNMQNTEGARDKSPGLSIVVPVYNEIGSISSTMGQLLTIMEEAGFPVEVILVDDCCNDGTESILSALDKPGFRVTRNTTNLGYGGSLKKGIRKAKYEYVATTDADGTYPNHRLPEFYQRCLDEDLDMCIGARTGLEVHIPAIRRPAKWILNNLANFLTNRKIPDLNSGLRVMRRKTVMQYYNILPNGFSFSTTITLGMLTQDFKVEFVPIDYYQREGKSKIRPIRDTLNFLQLIVRTVIYFDPLKVFLPLSLILFLVSICWGLLTHFVLGRFADTSTLVIFVAGFQVLAIGLLADLIDRRLTPMPDREEEAPPASSQSESS